MSAHHRHFAGILMMSMLPALGSGCGRKAGASSDSDFAAAGARPAARLVDPRWLADARENQSRGDHGQTGAPRDERASHGRGRSGQDGRISPPLPGRVVKLLVRLGEAVKQGAPLFTLDSSDLVAAQTDYLKARSAEAQANRAVARQKDLVEARHRSQTGTRGG